MMRLFCFSEESGFLRSRSSFLLGFGCEAGASATVTGAARTVDRTFSIEFHLLMGGIYERDDAFDMPVP